MNKQQIFDTAASHLLRQRSKAQSTDGNLVCVYRSARGKQCAVGCFIHTRHYTPDVENQSISDAYHIAKVGRAEDSDMDEPEDGVTMAKALIGALKKSGLSVNSRNVELLEDLQHTHDGYVPKEWQYALIDLAAKYNLSPAVVGHFWRG